MARTLDKRQVGFLLIMKIELKIKTETLTTPQSMALRTWLGKSEAEHLRMIVAGKAKEQLAKATNNALGAVPGNGFESKSLEHIVNAQKYQTFLDVFQEVLDHKGDFEVKNLE